MRRDKVQVRVVEEDDGRMFGSVQWLDHSYAEARVDNVDRIFLPRARISKCSLN